ncbi:MAG TPA: hypothetical protein DCY07_01390 [Rhodospirillaceae bacterium]|nr:hypothetical protein [Rhodospirillaceae bacterium]
MNYYESLFVPRTDSSDALADRLLHVLPSSPMRRAFGISHCVTSLAITGSYVYYLSTLPGVLPKIAAASIALCAVTATRMRNRSHVRSAIGLSGEAPRFDQPAIAHEFAYSVARQTKMPRYPVLRSVGEGVLNGFKVNGVTQMVLAAYASGAFLTALVGAVVPRYPGADYADSFKDILHSIPSPSFGVRFRAESREILNNALDRRSAPG